MRTNQPKIGFNFSASIFLDKAVPIIIPTIAKAEIVNKNYQSIRVASPSPKKPINDLAAIITNEIPTASFIGNLLKNTKAGITRNPPPAPTNPVRMPTKAPSISING